MKRSKYACVFGDQFVREQIDPRVQAIWKAEYGRGAPFGDLRRTWRKEHCASLNPYGSAGCAYESKDCALAFLAAVQSSIGPGITRPAGYFRRVARSTALVRADNKPLTRDRKLATDVLPKASPQEKDARGQPWGPGYPTDGTLRDAPGPMGDVDPLRGQDSPWSRIRPVDDDRTGDLHRSRARPASIGSLLGKNDSGARKG